MHKFIKTITLFTLCVNFYGCGSANNDELVIEKSYCETSPTCIIKNEEFMTFIEDVASCKDTAYIFYYGFGSARLTTLNDSFNNTSENCTKDIGQIKIAVKTEVEMSDYSVYSCFIDDIKIIDWMANDNLPPDNLGDKCNFVGIEQR